MKEAITWYEYDESENVMVEYTPGDHENRRGYDGNDRLIEERTLDKQNGIDRRVCYGYDAAGEISYYHRDEQLSTVLLTDRRGEIQAHYHYDAFGVELEREEQEENRPRYTGRQYDAVTEQVLPEGEIL